MLIVEYTEASCDGTSYGCECFDRVAEYIVAGEPEEELAAAGGERDFGAAAVVCEAGAPTAAEAEELAE